MNAIDATLVHWLQSGVQRSWIVDCLIVFVGTSTLLRGSVFATMMWWLWWRYQSQRDRAIAAFISSIVAVFVARVVANMFPFRIRPLFDTALQFRPPFEGKDVYRGHDLIGWSAFPSDHAVLFLALATGVFFVSRRLGVLTGLYALLMVCFPRAYMGIHYPTDLLFSVLLGMAIGYALQCTPFRRVLARPILERSVKHPAEFYAAAFLVTSQMAAMFADFQLIARKIVSHLTGHIWS